MAKKKKITNVNVEFPAINSGKPLDITFSGGKNLRREKNTPWPGQKLIPTKLNGYG